MQAEDNNYRMISVLHSKRCNIIIYVQIMIFVLNNYIASPRQTLILLGSNLFIRFPACLCCHRIQCVTFVNFPLFIYDVRDITCDDYTRGLDISTSLS
jgi:hypothetical protein